MDTVDEYRIGKAEERGIACECALCHFCDMPLAPTHEHDHFPIPRNAGGTATVPACKNCHTLKDRVNLLNHPSAEQYFIAVNDMFRFLRGSPENVAEWIDRDVWRLMDHVDHDLMSAAWPTVAPYTRVIYAKLLRIHTEHAQRVGIAP